MTWPSDDDVIFPCETLCCPLSITCPSLSVAFGRLLTLTILVGPCNMAVQEQILPSITSEEDASLDEAQVFKDIMDDTVPHPIDSFVTEMSSKEWDFDNGAQDLLSAPSPLILLPLPPTNDVVPSAVEARRTNHKRTVTIDRSSPIHASPEKHAPALAAEDWKIGAEQLLDIEPTPISELMLSEPITLLPSQVPPSPPTSTVLTPSPPATLALPEEMPLAVSAPPVATATTSMNEPLLATSMAAPSAVEPIVAPSTHLVAPINAPIPAPRSYPSYNSTWCPAVAPKPSKAKHGRKKREPQVVQYVDEPSELDCVLGRGGKSNHHPGNKRYRAEVQNLQKWYKSSGKSEKTELAQCLVDYVHNYGGRFLKQEKGTDRWYVVSNLVARRKASQALREHMTMEERAAKRAAMLAPAGMSTN